MCQDGEQAVAVGLGVSGRGTSCSYGTWCVRTGKQAVAVGLGVSGQGNKL